MPVHSPLHFLCKSSYVPGLLLLFLSSDGDFDTSTGGGAVIGGGGGIEEPFSGDEERDGEAAKTFPIFDREPCAENDCKISMARTSGYVRCHVVNLEDWNRRVVCACIPSVTRPPYVKRTWYCTS